MEVFDFSGYATRNNIRCSDGRTIMKNAFADNDGDIVPLVFQHIHDDANNVLGHALLENREDGVYAYCKLNNTPQGRNAKELVENGDLTSLSIYANQLKHTGSNVTHGQIREVSLVLSGANPGAYIDNLSIAHADGGLTELEDEAIMYSGLDIDDYNIEAELYHADEEDGGGDETVQDVFDTLSDKQKTVVYYLIGEAIKQAGGSGKEMAQSGLNEGGKSNMKNNVFDQKGDGKFSTTLSHAEFQDIVKDAQSCGSFKEAFLAHAQTYGIENIDILFPDAKTVTNPPDWIKRETEWVNGVLSGTHHTPFSRIKSTAADITADEARAKGYVKGNLKKEEVFKLLKRVTTPTTIYKKQKLDRDDIIDITDLDVVSWIKSEMRMMLDEEIARAILVGDGRAINSEDKIDEEHIRPIWKDDDMYAHHVTIDSGYTPDALIETIIRAKKEYKGSGSPAFYTTTATVIDMLLLKDKIGRRLYNSVSELASAMGVSKIVEVPVMENLTRTVGQEGNEQELGLIGLIVNLKDYTVGADKGGQISMFDDFDIDYNQYKYLLETRMSGTLTHPKSALVIEYKVDGEIQQDEDQNQ